MWANSPYDLSGKTALVTGAEWGVGAAIAAALGGAGATVIAHYGSSCNQAKDNLESVSEERKFFIQSDLSVPGSARILWREALSQQGRIDILVNSAMVNVETPIEGSDEQWDSSWDFIIRVNVLEVASLMREVVPHFVSRGGGVLISTSSWPGQEGLLLPLFPAYVASIAAARAFTQTIAVSYAKNGVLAYIIASGSVQAGVSPAAQTHGDKDITEPCLAPGGLVPAEEIGDLSVFLASGKCKHLTGATIDINGAAYIR